MVVAMPDKPDAHHAALRPPIKTSRSPAQTPDEPGFWDLTIEVLLGGLRRTGKSGKKYKLLSEAQREAAIARNRGSLVRIVRVTDDGSRMVVEEE